MNIPCSFRFIYLARRVALLGVLFSLWGCMSSSVNVRPVLEQDTMLDSGQGLVIARIVNASSWPFEFNRLYISPKSVNDSEVTENLRLMPFQGLNGSSSIFASPIEAGSYTLSSITSFIEYGHQYWYAGYQYWYARSASADPRFGTFEVMPGKVTDLGTIIYYEKFLGEKYISIPVRSPNTANGEVLHTYFPWFDYDADSILSWNEDGYEQERSALYASVVQNPTAHNRHYLAGDGTLYHIGKLGVVIVRTKDGNWEMLALDTDIDLTAIAQDENGNIFVGGEEGIVFYKHAESDQWQDVSIENDYVIEEIIFNDQGDVDIFCREKRQASVFRANVAAEKISWSQHMVYNSIDGWMTSEEYEQQKAEFNAKLESLSYQERIQLKKKRGTQKIIDNIYTQEYRGKDYIKVTLRDNDLIYSNYIKRLFVYDPNDWQITPVEDLDGVDATFLSGKRLIGIKEPSLWSLNKRLKYMLYDDSTSSWVSLNNYIKCDSDLVEKRNNCFTPDGKKSYRKKKLDFFSMPIFYSDQQAIVVGSVLTQEEDSINLYESVDAGATWSLSEKELPNKYCSQLIPEFRDRLVLTCFGSTGDVYESLNYGKTWEHVREHETF